MKGDGFGTIAAIGFGLLVLYLVAKNLPTIQIPIPSVPPSGGAMVQPYIQLWEILPVWQAAAPIVDKWNAQQATGSTSTVQTPFGAPLTMVQAGQFMASFLPQFFTAIGVHYLQLPQQQAATQTQTSTTGQSISSGLPSWLTGNMQIGGQSIPHAALIAAAALFLFLVVRR